jgi:hypothetical protein
VSSERRTETRHPVVITIELSLGSSLSLHACENLSAGGAFFRHAIPFQVGTMVSVTFGLPGQSGLIRCQGEVVNVPAPKEYGMGLKFSGLAAAEQARIVAFAEKAARTGEPR